MTSVTLGLQESGHRSRPAGKSASYHMMTKINSPLAFIQEDQNLVGRIVVVQ